MEVVGVFLECARDPGVCRPWARPCRCRPRRASVRSRVPRSAMPESRVRETRGTGRAPRTSAGHTDPPVRLRWPSRSRRGPVQRRTRCGSEFPRAARSTARRPRRRDVRANPQSNVRPAESGRCHAIGPSRTARGRSRRACCCSAGNTFHRHRRTGSSRSRPGRCARSLAPGAGGSGRIPSPGARWSRRRSRPSMRYSSGSEASMRSSRFSSSNRASGYCARMRRDPSVKSGSVGSPARSAVARRKASTDCSTSVDGA